MRSPLPALLALAAALVAAVLAFAWWVAGTGAGAGAVPEPEQPLEIERASELREPSPPDLAAEAERTAARGWMLEVKHATPRQSSADGRVRAIGTVYDRVTNQPVPQLEFWLVDASNARADCVTDEFGAFETVDELALGRVHAHCHDNVDGLSLWMGTGLLEAVPAERDAGVSRPVLLVLSIGPTFLLSLGPPNAPPPEQFTARLAPPGSELAPEGNGALATVGGSTYRVRAGQPPWVRWTSGASSGTVRRS